MLAVQTPTTPQTDPLAGITPSVNVPLPHAPNRELNDSFRMLETLPSSLCVNVVTVTALLRAYELGGFGINPDERHAMWLEATAEAANGSSSSKVG